MTAQTWTHRWGTVCVCGVSQGLLGSTPVLCSFRVNRASAFPVSYYACDRLAVSVQRFPADPAVVLAGTLCSTKTQNKPKYAAPKQSTCRCIPPVAPTRQNMRYRPRGEGHGQGPGGSKAPIGAHAGEVKGGTIDWGHMSTRLDQFGSKGYDLLADEPRPVEAVGMQQGGCTVFGAGKGCAR